MATTYTTPLPPGVTADEQDAEFDRLKVLANAAWRDTMRGGTPADRQVYLDDYLTVNPPAPPDGSAVVRNGQSVVVHNAADAVQAGSPAAANVTGNTLNFVKLTV